MKKREQGQNARRKAADAGRPHAMQAVAAAQPPQLVQIEKPIYGGAFLARAEGKAVFVPLTLPGERARVRIVEEKRGYATAEAEEIVAAARGAGCACVSALRRVRRLPVSARGLCGAARFQAGHSARDARARRRSRAGRDGRAGRGTLGLSQSHPARVRRGGKRGIPRAAIARSDSDCGMPDCGAVAGAGRAGCSGVFPEIWPAKPPRGALALLECSRGFSSGQRFHFGRGAGPAYGLFRRTSSGSPACYEVWSWSNRSNARASYRGPSRKPVTRRSSTTRQVLTTVSIMARFSR